ncbi:MAG: acyl-CoA/acyl-ACP dehydrogenase [Nitrososphaerota archaeon]|nr:acyl-CoA/acyl-ACP dehydrogenase [Nitrososphaerota archaeon]
MSSPVNFPKNPLISLTQDEELFRSSVAEFAAREIAPSWERWDQESSERHVVQREMISRLAGQGLLAMTCSPEHGGQGGTQTMATIALEELAYADPSVGSAVYALLNIGWPFLLGMYGRQEVAGSVIERVSRGEAFFGIASTESQGGSDIANLKSSAAKKGDGYVISGTKSFISGVNEVFGLPWGGGWFVLARTGGPGRAGLSGFAALPKEGGRVAPGVSHSLFEVAGKHSLSTGSVTFDGLEVGRGNLVGEEGRGFYLAMEGFNCARILVAAACVGASRWLLERAAEWLKSREIGGRRLSSYQSVGFRFAELVGKYEAARMMVYRAARLFDKVYFERQPGYSKGDLNAPVAMAKMMGPEVSMEIGQEVMRWFGASSFVRSHPVQRSVLGLLSYVVGAEGAQNVMKYIVSREVLGHDSVRD